MPNEEQPTQPDNLRRMVPKNMEELRARLKGYGAQDQDLDTMSRGDMEDLLDTIESGEVHGTLGTAADYRNSIDDEHAGEGESE